METLKQVNVERTNRQDRDHDQRTSQDGDRLASVVHVNMAAGYSLRPARMSDLEQVVDLIRRCEINEIGATNIGVSEIKGDWTSPRFELSHNTCVALSEDGQVVGYQEIWDTSDIPVAIWCWGCVHPAHEGHGIGSALLKWAETRARLAVPRCPEDARVVIRAGCNHSHQPAHDLLAGYGMRPGRYFWEMEIELSNSELAQPIWPDGITLCTYRDLDDLRQVVIAVDDAFQDHFGHVKQPIDSMMVHWRHWLETDDKIDLDMCYLAMDGDEIAGICLCRLAAYSHPDSGYINTLGVRRAWRRKGIALGLLHHAFRAFAERGYQKVQLGVDASSLTGATRLYERAGMHVILQHDDYEMELRPGRDLMKRSL